MARATPTLTTRCRDAQVDCVMSALRLFDDIARTDASPALNQEGSFAFLNRVATPWWNQVRELLEGWFADYAAGADSAKAADIRSRFRSGDGRQHSGAWWELYVHVLLRRTHPDVWIGVEPEREGHATRPDFCVAEGADSRPLMWVEAVTTQAGVLSVDGGSPAEAYVLDTINEVRSRDFRVAIRIHSAGVSHPRKRDITRPLSEWLDGLNRNDVLADTEAGIPRPRTTITAGEWSIELEALPKGAPGLEPRDRLIGFGPAKGGFLDDAGKARTAIRGKAGHYGGLAAPLVVAVLPLGGPFDFEDAVAALYGSEAVRFDPADPEVTAEAVRRPDGIWSMGGAEVSAVLLGNMLSPWTVAKTWPELWVNPTPTYVLMSDFDGVPRVELRGDGRLERVAAAAETPAGLFSLPDEWPGSDPWAES